MDPEKVKKNQEYAELAFWTGHYHYMMQALAVAMCHTMVWRLVGDGTPFTLKELFEFARDYDEEHEIEDPFFYYVSREGAIGLSPGLEYLTEWMFVPMEPCQERDFLLRDLQERLQEEAAAEEAVNKAVDAGVEREWKNATRYYMLVNGEKVGPHTARQMMHKGLTLDTQVWSEGMPSWVKASQVPELAALLSPAAAPQAAAAAQYHMYVNGQKIGPLSIDQMIKQGLTRDTQVWTKGMASWVKAADVPQLAQALSAPAPAPAPAPQPAVKYHISRGGQRLGPFTVQELLQNNLTPDTLVWTDGMSGWAKAADVPQLANLLRK